MCGCLVQSLIVGLLAGAWALVLVVLFGGWGVLAALGQLAVGGVAVGYLIATSGPYDAPEDTDA